MAKYKSSGIKTAFGIFAAFLILQFSVFGQAASRIADQAKFVTEFEVNGLKVIVKRRATSPTVSAGLFFRGGVKNVTKENAGIEGLTLGVATEGSKKFPKDILRKELSRTGSSFSSGASLDYSLFSFSSTRQNFDRSWEIFSDIVINPHFAEDDFERIREAALTGLRNRDDDPDSFLQNLVDNTVYANHPYANAPEGTIGNISKFTTADLRAYHKTLLQTSRMLLVMVGDIDAGALEGQIAASFGKLPRGNYKETLTPDIKFDKPTLHIEERNLPTNYIQGEFPAPGLGNPDFFAMRVATTILRDRLFEEVRVKRNLSYAPSADMNMLAANTANIYVSAVDANRSVSVMLNEIRKMQSELVKENDISGVAGQFLTTYFLGQETNAAQAAELARYELLGGGWRNSLGFLNSVKKVTPEEVRAVSAKYMKNIRFVVVGNPASVNREIFTQISGN